MTGTPTTKGTGGDDGSGDLALEPIAKAAKRLGVGKTTAYGLIAAGKLRRARLPGVRSALVVSADVDALIREAIGS